MKKIVFLLLLITLSTGYYYKEQIIHLDFFDVKTIQISESKHYDFNSLLKEVAPKEKISVFDIDLTELEKRLFKLSWIKKVQISKVLPDKLYITITEHKIDGVVLFDSLYFFDKDYQVFLKPEIKKTNPYIIFSGLKKETYKNNFNYFKKQIKEMKKIAKIFKLSDLSKDNEIDEIYLSKFRGYHIILKNGTKILLKNNDYFLTFNRVKKIISKSMERKEVVTTIIFDELKAKNKVIVKLREDT